MSDPFRIHMISDSTGETIAAALRASVAMFGDVRVAYRRHVMIRTQSSLGEALDSVEKDPGLVIHTVVDPVLRAQLERRCTEIGVRTMPFLDPMMHILTHFFERPAAPRPGLQHAVDERYYRRVAALDYALANDDGNLGARLAEADVVLIGVSRTSKTPTCVYLAGRGVKAANVPLLPGCPLPIAVAECIEGDGPLIVGLTAKPTRLAQIRANRLSALRHDDDAAYADLEAVRQEVREARSMMEALDCPVIDVTRRSIEETAADIIRMLEHRAPEAPR